MGGHVGAALALALSVTLAASPGARGEGLPQDAGAARTVAMFDLFCFGLLPDLEAIAEIADANFEPIVGEDLARYQPAVPAEELKAWRFNDFDQQYVLTTARSAPDDALIASFPEFADATSYACSLILPQQDPQEEVRSNMSDLMERTPDDTYDQPPLRAAEWIGQTESMMVNVFHYAPAGGGAGGLLSSIAFVRP